LYARGLVPSTLTAHQRRDDSGLPSEYCQRGLHVQQPRLRLEDEQRSAVRVPSEDVDRTPVAEVVEGVLDDQFPAARSHRADRMLHDGGVSGIEQPDVVAAAPPRHERQLDLEDRGDPAGAPHGELIQVPALHQRDEALAGAGPPPHLPLRPAQPMPNGTRQCADTKIIHGPMLPVAVQPAYP
jgi:hypothetical protein